MSKSKTGNTTANNPKGRGYNRTFISPSLLGLRSPVERRELASRESAARWQRERDACMERLATMTGEDIPEDLLASFTTMFENFKGIEHTTEVPRIHRAYRKVSRWAWPHLMHVGRSTVSIAPMIAIPLTWTVVEIPVGDTGGVVQVTRNSDGFSGRIQMSENGNGFTEIGSLGDEFGVLQVCKGQTFTNASGQRRTDWVKFCAIASANFDGRIFNDAVEEGNAEVVVAALREMTEVIFADRAAHREAIKAVRASFYFALKDEVRKVIKGDVKATRAAAAAASAGPDPEAMLSSTSAAATVLAATIPADPEEIAKTGETKTIVEMSSALTLSDAAEIVKDNEVLDEVPSNVATHATAESIVAQMRECAAARDAAQEVAMDAAVASAVANDPEAAKVMADIEAEIARRADEAAAVSAAAAVVAATTSAAIDAEVAAEMAIEAEIAAALSTPVIAAEVDEEYEPEMFLVYHADEIPLKAGIYRVHGKEVKVVSIRGGAQLLASAAESDNMRISIGEDIADCRTFGEARERRQAAHKK